MKPRTATSGVFFDCHGWQECRKCRSIFRQAMDGRYAGPLPFPTPADTSHIPVGRNCRSKFRRSMDGRYTGNAGAIASVDVRRRNSNSFGVPDSREHFPHPCGSEMQEHDRQRPWIAGAIVRQVIAWGVPLFGESVTRFGARLPFHSQSCECGHPPTLRRRRRCESRWMHRDRFPAPG